MPAGEVSFALKETVRDFNGGSVVVGEKVVNLKSRLGDDGVITTSDPQEIAAFDEIEVLKQVSKDTAKSGDSAGGGKK